MSLYDAIAAELPDLRDEATVLMIDTCTVERRELDGDGEPVRVMDPVTLEYVDSWLPIYSGACRIQRPNISSPREATAGEYQFGVHSLIAQLPHGTPGIIRKDRLTVTAVGTDSDPDLVGLVATVEAVPAKTHATKRTLICEEVT